jgi:hypothetical protein
MHGVFGKLFFKIWFEASECWWALHAYGTNNAEKGQNSGLWFFPGLVGWWNERRFMPCVILLYMLIILDNKWFPRGSKSILDIRVS